VILDTQQTYIQFYNCSLVVAWIWKFEENILCIMFLNCQARQFLNMESMSEIMRIISTDLRLHHTSLISTVAEFIKIHLELFLSLFPMNMNIIFSDKLDFH
jgi:hypothetical protein